MKTILSTKKLNQAAKKILIDAQFTLVEKNYIKTNSKAFEINEINEILIFTSKKAVKSVLKNSVAHQLKEKKTICVGQKTKEYLEKNNFKVIDYRNYAHELVSLIEEKYKTFSFTFFSGNIRKNTLPNFFNSHQIHWNEVEVYETTLTPKKIKEKIDGILFFSPSAIESYFIENKIENQTCFCIGTTTAKALEHKTKNIKIAAQPTVENVIKEVIKHYK